MAGNHTLGTIRGTIEIDYDGAGIVKAVRDTDKAKKTLGGMDGAVGKTVAGLGKFAKGAAIAGGAISSVQNAVHLLIGVLSVVGPIAAAAFAAAPAVILGFQSALIITKIAVAGVGDALKAASKDGTKFQEALKKLSPEAQKFAKAYKAALPALDAVKKSIQDAFFRDTAGQVQGVVTRIASLQAQAVGVAGAIGGVAKSIITTATSGQSLEGIRTILSGVNGFILQIGPNLAPIVQGFISIAAQAANFGSVAGGQVAGALQKLGTFLNNVDVAGIFQKALPILQQLGILLGNLGSVVSSVLTGITADGAGAVSVLSNLVAALAQFLQSAEGQSALAALGQAFTAVGGAAGQIFLALLKALGPVLVALAPSVAQLATTIAGILVPVIGQLGPLLQQLAPVVGALANALLGLLGPAITAVVSILAAVVPAVLPIVSILVGALVPIFQMLAPIIALAAQIISQLLVTALTALMPLFTALIPVVLQLLSAVLIPLAPILQLIGQLFLALMPILTPLIQILVTLINVAMVPLLPIINLLVGLLRVLVIVIAAVVTPIAAVIGWIVRLIAGLLNINTAASALSRAWAVTWGAIKAAALAVANWVTGSLVPAFVRAWNNFKTSLNLLASAWRATWNGIKAVAFAIWNAIVAYIRTQVAIVKAVIGGIVVVVGVVRNAFSRAYAAVRDAIGKVISTVRGLPGRVSSALGNLGSLLYNKGVALVQGFIRGIAGMIGRVRDTARSVVSAVTDFLPGSPAKKGPLSGRGYALLRARRMMKDLAKGMKDRSRLPVKAVLGAVRPVTTAIAPRRPGFDPGGSRRPDPHIAPDLNAGGTREYPLIIGGREFARIVVDAVTGEPVAVSKASKEGSRRSAWAGSGR